MTHAISETTSNAEVDHISLDYTNRRRLKITPKPDDKSNETRKTENEDEYENVCIRIAECFISKPSTLNVRNKSQTSSTRTSSSTSSRHPEINEFKRLLEERGGHYGGWKEEDHLFFVKIRAKNPPGKTARIIMEHFPDLQEEDIMRHDAWYSEYQRLRAANRRAIEEWKRSKKEAEKRLVKAEEPQPIKQKVKRDPDVREKIEIWKAKCLASKIERLQNQRLEEMRKLREEEHRKQMQEERKRILSQHLKEKKELEASLNTAKEVERDLAKKEATKRAKILLRHYRFEDRRFTARQQERAAKRRPPEETPIRRSGSRAPRDPLRILRPTLGWTLRTKKPLEPTPPVQPQHIQHLRHLGRPAWRKGVTS